MPCYQTAITYLAVGPAFCPIYIRRSPSGVTTQQCIFPFYWKSLDLASAHLTISSRETTLVEQHVSSDTLALSVSRNQLLRHEGGPGNSWNHLLSRESLYDGGKSAVMITNILPSSPPFPPFSGSKGKSMLINKKSQKNPEPQTM
jgi:hypothetical protein